MKNGQDLIWKEYLTLGEELLRLPDTLSLVNKLQTLVDSRLACKSKLWLCEPFYPLPAEPPIDTLPRTNISQTVQTAYTKKTTTRISKNESQNPSQVYEIAIPVTTHDNTLGIFHILRDQDHPFTQDEQDYIDGLIAFVAVSMQVNRQVTLKNWRYDQLSLVRSVSSQIANELDLDELSKKVTSLIQCSFDYYHVGLYTLEERSQKLRFRASSLACNPSDNPLVEVVFGQGLVGEVARTGQEIICKDVSTEPRYRSIDALPNTRAEAVIPLVVENRVLGVLDIQSDSPVAFHENDMLVIRSLADNIALAVEGARLYNSLVKRADQLAALADINYSLSQILDLEKLLQEIVNVIRDRFDLPFVHIFSVHPGRRKIIYEAGSGQKPRNIKSKAFAFSLDAPKGIIPYVARTGEPVLANDVTKQPLYKPSKAAPTAIKAELTVPLKFGEDVLGILDLQSDTLNAFTEDDLSLFEGLASGIALSIRNANIFNTERWRRSVADSFKDVASLLSKNLALDELLEKILVELEKNLPCDASAIWLLNTGEEGDSISSKLKLAAVRGTDRESITHSVGESQAVRGFLEYAIDKNEPVIRKPTDPYGPLGVASKFKSNYSSIAVPLFSSNEVIGVLTLAHKAEGRYGSETAAIATTFASYAAVAIENARLYTTAQEDAWSSTVLLQVAESMHSISTTNELLSTIVRLTPLLVGVNQCALYLYNPNTFAYEMKKWYGFTPAENEIVLTDGESVGLIRVQATMSPVYINDLQKELGINSFSVPESTGTLVLIPLISHDELMGLFLVSHNSAGEFGITNKFTSQTLAILTGIAQQTSVTLENIQLVENRQMEAYITAVLLQVAQAVVSQNELQDILDTVVHLLSILVGLDASVIYLWDSVTSDFTVSNATSTDQQEADQLVGTVFHSGDNWILDQVHSSDQLIACPLPKQPHKFGFWETVNCEPVGDLNLSLDQNWLLGFPLSIKGAFYGVLVAQESNVQPSLHNKRIELIKGVAQQTTLAIQNEFLKKEMVDRERIEREFQLAREIQKTFLPESTPHLEGWDIDLKWQTAREVGGDFYDLFETKDKKLAIVIADVSDKGMPAALYMTVTRTLIRATAQTTTLPGAILERVNSLLEMESRNGMFVTAFLAILDPATGVLTYANGGHNLPIWFKGSSSETQRLEMDGIALAVTSDAKYANKKITLSSGDYLLLYTDGVTEATNSEDEIFTEPHLFELVKNSNISSSGELLSTVENAIHQFRDGALPSDDLTMISIHRKD